MKLRSGRFLTKMSIASSNDEKISQWVESVSDPQTQRSSSPSDKCSVHESVVSSKSGSCKSVSSTRSMRMKEAQVKLKLARLKKEQNVARCKEKEQLAEMQRQISAAEDDRRIRAAEVEVSVWAENISSLNKDHNAELTPEYPLTVNHASVPMLNHSTTELNFMKNQMTPTIPLQQSKQSTVRKEYFSTQDIPFMPAQGNSTAAASEHRRINREEIHPFAFADRFTSDPIKAEEQPYKSRYERERPNDFIAGDQTKAHQWGSGSRYDAEELRLPKLEIKLFEGDPMDFGAFLNRFKSHVPDSLPNGKKMSYLLQYCNDKVRNQIQHYADNERENPRCYELAWCELRRRYGLPHVIAQACEERLLVLPNLNKPDPECLGKMSILMNRCCSALEDVPGASSLDTVHFISMLAHKLPYLAREEWVKYAVRIGDGSGRVATFRDFASFVSEQARIANSIYGLKLFSLQPVKSNSSQAGKSKVASFTASSTSQGAAPADRNDSPLRNKCLLCEGPHVLYVCGKFCSKSFEEKWEIVRNLNLCKLCLKPGHFSRQCKSLNSCKKGNCGSRNHHTLLHPSDLTSFSNSKTQRGNDADKIKGGEWQRNDNRTGDEAKVNVHSVTLCDKGAYLDIVPVSVTCNDRTIATYALLDSGSDRTFCERQLTAQLGVKPSSWSKIALQTLSSGHPKRVETAIVSLQVAALEGGPRMSLSNVIVLDKIPVQPNPFPRAQMLQHWPHLRNVPLSQIDEGSVMLLIGNDHPVMHRCLESRFSSDPCQSPDAIRTPLGWLLRGRHLENKQVSTITSSFLIRGFRWSSDVEDLQNLIVTDEGEMFPSSSCSDLYDKEEFIKLLLAHKEMLEFGTKFSLQDPIAYDVMTRKLRYEDGHYELPLLWRNDAERLPDSQEMAFRRLESLKKRLQKDNALRQKYVDKIEETIRKGYAEVVPQDEISPAVKQWYLPHHPVINPKKPEKLRIVYDCAATAHGRSLNDFLMKGPDLMNSLTGVLLRFRKGPIAIISDIEAMFYQVKVAKSDRDAMRFLWWPQGNFLEDPMVYRMTVHLFGAKSSPSCVSFCLRETAREYGKFYDPNVAEMVFKHFYADDCLVTAETDAVAIKLVKDLRELLSKGGFKLTKWLSNSEKVMESISDDDKAKSAQNVSLTGELQERVLGIKWDVDRDEFYFTVEVPDEKPTKRRILSVTNSLYDPLGFVAPVVLEARLIYSDVCQKIVNWDDPIDDLSLKRWTAWRNSLSQLKLIRIPRWYKLKTFGEAARLQLHFFCDASKSARGSVCYLRCSLPDSSITCSLVMGKALLPGAGRHTIPRLELEAALDAVNMYRTLKQELDLHDCPCLFWSDSMIVLQSLMAETKKFPMFSRNRLQKILAHTCVYDWRYVPSESNPADQASRGMSTEALVRSEMWLNGPKFLWRLLEYWPKYPMPNSQSDVDYDVYKLVRTCPTHAIVTSDVKGTDKLITYFSSLRRLLVATA